MNLWVNILLLKCGGPADIFIKINNIDEIKCILKIVKEKNIPLTILGNCTNILVKDQGIRGIVLQINLTKIDIDEETINVESGVLISKLANIAYKNSLSGLEFASGIPGTVGGAIAMNAGAYDRWDKRCINKNYIYW